MQFYTGLYTSHIVVLLEDCLHLRIPIKSDVYRMLEVCSAKLFQ